MARTPWTGSRTGRNWNHRWPVRNSPPLDQARSDRYHGGRRWLTSATSRSRSAEDAPAAGYASSKTEGQSITVGSEPPKFSVACARARYQKPPKLCLIGNQTPLTPRTCGFRHRLLTAQPIPRIHLAYPVHTLETSSPRPESASVDFNPIKPIQFRPASRKPLPTGRGTGRAGTPAE